LFTEYCILKLYLPTKFALLENNWPVTLFNEIKFGKLFELKLPPGGFIKDGKPLNELLWLILKSGYLITGLIIKLYVWVYNKLLRK
jgi:hypothetical protein